MSTNSQKEINDQEIDLSVISDKIAQSYQNLLKWIFNCIQFLIKNIFYLILLLSLGLIIGYFMDKKNKTFDHEIYVNPNFGSIDLLYSKINLLQSKIREKDTVFFQSIGIKKAQSISLIKVEPIIDVYGFVNQSSSSVSNAQNTQNFELLKLLSESSDINKIIKADLTGRNYSTHLIKIKTKEVIAKESVIEPIMSFLNNEKYFTEVKDAYATNIKYTMLKNEEVIIQIDTLLAELNSKIKDRQTNNKLIYYNENSQVNEVLATKNSLISEQGRLKLLLITNSEIVRVNSSVLNVINAKSFFLKMKFILPVFFIFIFILIVNFISFYKKQSLLNKVS